MRLSQFLFISSYHFLNTEALVDSDGISLPPFHDDSNELWCGERCVIHGCIISQLQLDSKHHNYINVILLNTSQLLHYFTSRITSKHLLPVTRYNKQQFKKIVFQTGRNPQLSLQMIENLFDFHHRYSIAAF